MIRDVSKWGLLKDVTEISSTLREILVGDVPGFPYVVKRQRSFDEVQRLLEALYNKLNGYLLALEETLLRG